MQNLYLNLDECKETYDLIDKAIIEDPPITIKEGGIIKQGYNEEVDEYKIATVEGRQWLLNIEDKEKEKTGIKNLKIGFNKVFGYFLEVTKSYLNLVPEYYVRKQTLANCERYITEELNEVESKILGAEEKIVNLEYELFIDIRNKQPVDATSCVGNAFIEYPDGTKVHKSVYPISNKDGILAVMLDKEDTKDTGVHRIIMSLMNGEYYVIV